MINVHRVETCLKILNYLEIVPTVQDTYRLLNLYDGYAQDWTEELIDIQWSWSLARVYWKEICERAGTPHP